MTNGIKCNICGIEKPQSDPNIMDMRGYANVVSVKETAISIMQQIF